MCPFLATQLISYSTHKSTVHLSPFGNLTSQRKISPAVSKFTLKKLMLHIVELPEKIMMKLYLPPWWLTFVGLAPIDVGHRFWA